MSKCCKDTQIYFDISGALLGAYVGYVIFRPSIAVGSGGKKEKEKLPIGVAGGDKTVETAPQELPPEPPLPAPFPVPSIRTFLFKGVWWVGATSVTIYLKRAMKPYVMRIYGPAGKWLAKIFGRQTNAANELWKVIAKKFGVKQPKNIFDDPLKKKSKKKPEKKKPEEPTVTVRDFIIPEAGESVVAQNQLGTMFQRFLGNIMKVVPGSEDTLTKYIQDNEGEVEEEEEEEMVISRRSGTTAFLPPTAETQVQDLRDFVEDFSTDSQNRTQEELNKLADKKGESSRSQLALEAAKRREQKLLQDNAETQGLIRELMRKIDNMEKMIKAARSADLPPEQEKRMVEKLKEELVGEGLGETRIEIRELATGGQVSSSNTGDSGFLVRTPEPNNSNRPITEEDRAESLVARRTTAQMWARIQEQVENENARNREAVLKRIQEVELQNATPTREIPQPINSTFSNANNIDNERARGILRMADEMFRLVRRMDAIINGLSGTAFDRVTIPAGKKMRSGIPMLDVMRNVSGVTGAERTYYTRFLEILRERRRIAVRMFFAYFVLIYMGINENTSQEAIGDANAWVIENEDAIREILVRQDGTLAPSEEISRADSWESILRIRPLTRISADSNSPNPSPLGINLSDWDTSILAFFARSYNERGVITSGLEYNLNQGLSSLHIAGIQPRPVRNVRINYEDHDDEYENREQNIIALLADLRLVFDDFTLNTEGRQNARIGLIFGETVGPRFFQLMNQIFTLYIGIADIPEGETQEGRNVPVTHGEMLDMVESITANNMVNVSKFTEMINRILGKKK